LAAGIGLVTPPVGSVLFLGASIGKISVMEAVRGMWPFYIAALTVLAFVMVFPQLSLWLPSLLA
jgi:TRAP-type C4-dicarboxylate transport system permease large subunit